MNISHRKFLAMVLTVLSSAFAMVSAWAETPAVVWISQPVVPGEAVVVYGGPWGDVKEIELAGPDKRAIKSLKVTDDCVTFVYPADWPLAAFTARVADQVSVRVNAPDVWWLQGDNGAGASPGGWLRAFGRCIGYDKRAFLEFRGAGRTIKVAAAACDLYALRVELAGDFPAGEYEVFVGNGLDATPVTAGKIKIAPRREPWPEKIFNVVDYGAIANDANDDSRAVRAALSAIATNGGGVLFFPRGRFGMRGTLELPRNTLLRGEDLTLSQIYWLDEDDPKGALVSGKYNFGIENIFLAAGNIDSGIVVVPPEEGETWKNENILLRRVRTRFLHTDNFVAEESFRRSRGGDSALHVRGEFIRIVDCDFYFSKCDSSIHGEYLLATGNRFTGPGCSYLGGQHCIFENNDSEGRGMSFANGNRCFFMKGNRIGAVYGDGDRETFTFDGGDSAYADTVLSASGRNLKLKPGAWRHGAPSWIGRPIYIIGGKGAGQMRFITRIKGRDVEIDRPWDIAPDGESYFVIALVRSKLLFLANHDCDGNPFALYGSAADVVLAGNRLERVGGMHAHGMFKGVPEPSWFVQFLDNELLEGNSVRGPFSFQVPADDSWLGFFDRGIRRPLTYPQNRVGIMRRNVLHSNAYLDSHGRVKNVLMENNLVKNADQGVVLGPDVQDAILRGNRFENVVRPYRINEQTMVSPADRLLAGLSAAATLKNPSQNLIVCSRTLHGCEQTRRLKPAATGFGTSCKPLLPDDWSRYIAEAEALAKKDSSADAADILRRAARALAAKVGDRTIPSSVVAALFGLDLSQNNPWLFSRLVPGKSTKVNLGSGNYPSWSLPATLTATTEGFDGWQIRFDPAMKLVPGKPVPCAMNVTCADATGPFSLLVEFVIAGDGWKFKFREHYTRDTFEVGEFLVAGPFKNASGKAIDTEVHPPEIKLDVTASYDTLDGHRPWLPAKADADLSKVFKNTEMVTAHAVAVVRAARPVLVKVAAGGETSLLFVNGDRLGSSARRGGSNRCVELKQGDNLFHLISSHRSGAWPINFKVTVVDPVKPGELRVVPAEELPKALAPLRTAVIPEGKSLPNALDVDWKLVYSDDFNRLRLGSGWKCQSPPWMSQNACIVENALASEAGWGYLTFEQAVTPPVRIEFDMLAQGSMGGALLCPNGLAWRNLWGNLAGRGYCLSLGWHDAKNNRVMRDTETVLLDAKSPPLERGKWHHVTVQFVPPRCQLYVDSKLTLDYQDPAFLHGLDRIGLFTIGGNKFDNVRIYTPAK